MNELGIRQRKLHFINFTARTWLWASSIRKCELDRPDRHRQTNKNVDLIAQIEPKPTHNKMGRITSYLTSTTPMCIGSDIRLNFVARFQAMPNSDRNKKRFKLIKGFYSVLNTVFVSKLQRIVFPTFILCKFISPQVK